MGRHRVATGLCVTRPVVVAAVVVILVISGCSGRGSKRAPAAGPTRDAPSVLVFTRTTAFRHASTDDGVAAIRRLGAAHGFTVEATEDPARIEDDALGRFQVVVFLPSTGEPLDRAQQEALRRWVEGRGGWVGVHAAADAMYDWPWYGELVGAWFRRHPNVQRATVRVRDRDHPSTRSLPAAWTRTDEWYDFRDNPRGPVQVLAAVDESSYQGGGMAPTTRSAGATSRAAAVRGTRHLVTPGRAGPNRCSWPTSLAASSGRQAAASVPARRAPPPGSALPRWC